MFDAAFGLEISSRLFTLCIMGHIRVCPRSIFFICTAHCVHVGHLHTVPYTTEHLFCHENVFPNIKGFFYVLTAFRDMAGGIMFSGCPSVCPSFVSVISQEHLEWIFWIWNVHLESKTNWLDFGDHCVKVNVKGHWGWMAFHFPAYPFSRAPWGNFVKFAMKIHSDGVPHMWIQYLAISVMSLRRRACQLNP